MDKDQIVLNRIRTPDGTILTSRTRNDYVTYTDDNGLKYMVDGGHDYLRRNAFMEYPIELQYEELSVTLGDGHLKVREAFQWGTYGKDGTEPLKRIAVCEMSNAHIEAILADAFGYDWVIGVFSRELKYRKDNNILIED